MPSLRLLAAVLLGFGIVGACSTRSSPLAQDGDPAGSAGASAAAGSAGASAGSAGAAAGGAGGASGAAGDAGQGGGGGEAGAAGAAGAAGQAAAGGGGDAGAAGQGGPIVVQEPDGTPEFRLLNGLTDVPSARLCLVPWSGGAPSGIDATPQPQASELLYGDLLTPQLPPGVDPAAQALRPHLLTGDLSALGAQGCLALLQTPPQGVRITALPVLPPGTMTAPRSRLAVAVGCVGGSQAPDISSACGVGVDPALGNANLILVELSRIAPPAGQLGLQVVHASTAMPALAVRSMPSGSELSKTLVPQVTLGQITPRPPLAGSLDAFFGVSVAAAQIQLSDATNGAAVGAFEVGASLVESGIAPEQVTAGGGLVLLVLGPRPGSPLDAAPITPTRLRWLTAPAL